MVPGSLAGWLEALALHGSVGAKRAFAPAIELAERGFSLHPFNVKSLDSYTPRANAAGRAIFGAPPHRVGEVLGQPDLARSLHEISTGGAQVFYCGTLARKICDYIHVLSEADDPAAQANFGAPNLAPTCRSSARTLCRTSIAFRNNSLSRFRLANSIRPFDNTGTRCGPCGL